jgi:hypothetical protein
MEVCSDRESRSLTRRKLVCLNELRRTLRGKELKGQTARFNYSNQLRMKV